MEDRYLEKYYTTDGVTALENRLKSLTFLYLKEIEYPFEAQILGFPKMHIHSREHHQGMIDDMCQILNRTNINVEVKKGG